MRNRMDCFGVLVYLLGSRAHYLASLPGGLRGRLLLLLFRQCVADLRRRHADRMRSVCILTRF